MKLFGFLVVFNALMVMPAMAQNAPNRHCGGDRWRVPPGPGQHNLEINVRVRSNGECNLGIEPRGSSPFTIVRRATNGTLRLTGTHAWQYIPRGREGSTDSFTLRFENRTEGWTATLRHNITVTPPAP
jgi:hypothetical protein